MLCRQIETVVVHGLVNGIVGLLEFQTNPLIGNRFNWGRALDSLIGAHQNIVGGVPKFIAKISVAFHAFQIEPHGAGARCNRAKSESQCIGAIGRDAVWIFFARRTLYFFLLACL